MFLNLFVSDINWLKLATRKHLTGSEIRQTYQVNQRAP